VPNSTQIVTRTCRLLYFGAEGTGKRENLGQIVESIPEDHRLALAAEDPQCQIAFRLRNRDQGEWNVLVQAVDAGREKYNFAGSQQAVPFDGIVFVVNANKSTLDQSLSTLEGLKTYLDTWGYDLMSIPVVLQYNQSAAQEILSVDRLESLLNPWGLLSFPANSARGEGVKETLKAILSLSISHLLQNPIPGDPQQTNQAGFDSGPPIQGTAGMPGQAAPGTAATPHPATTSPSVSVASSPVLATAPPEPTFSVPAQTPDTAQTAGVQPPLRVPVYVPRHALDENGNAHIVLEIRLVD